jgi:hypothetical protein
MVAVPPLHVTAPRLFQAWFPEPSWDTWRTVVKGAFALPLSPAEHERFREVAGGRAPPQKPVRELWCQVGRRGGKDAVASSIVTAAALVDYRPQLRRGERAVCMLLAVDRATADICRSYVSAHFEANPPLASLVVGETRDGLTLSNGCDIVIGTNTFRAVRGRTLACVVLDEVAFWRDETSVSPDFEVYRALKPGLMTLPGSMVIGIGSPYRKAGLLYDRFKACYGVDDPRTLYVKGPSELFTPLANSEEIAEEYAKDPASARAEYGAEFRDDIASFIDISMVEACVDSGVTVRPPRPGVSYVGFVDAASGTAQDSFAAAVAHRDKTDLVVDCVHEVRPPFSPSAAIADVAGVLKSYGVSRVVGDKWAPGFVAEGFLQHRVSYAYAERDRSQIYVECLPLLSSARARLVDVKKLATQFASLERRTSSGGRDRIDHPRDGHDDLANAAAGALVEVATAPQAMHIGDEILRQASQLRSRHGVYGGYQGPWSRQHLGPYQN